MTSDNIPYHVNQMAARFEQLRALVLASLKVADQYADDLSGQLDRESDTGPVPDAVRDRRRRVQDWLVRAEYLRAWLLEKSHEIGVLIERVEMGDLAPDDVTIRRTRQRLWQAHRDVALALVEAVGRARYHEALDIAENLLANDEPLRETEEFEQLRSDMETVDDILEGDPPADLRDSTSADDSRPQERDADLFGDSETTTTTDTTIDN